MVINGVWQGRAFTLSIKPNCLTISLPRDGDADVFSFDLAGRPWTALVAGVSYRRGLDGKVVAKWPEPGGERQRRWLAETEARQLEVVAHDTLAGLFAAIQNGQASLEIPLTTPAEAAIGAALAYDPARAAADIAAYHQVYLPVGILPPDQYFAVVLQATLGCAFNTCTFCDFYRDRPFRIRPVDEFRRHARQVRDFLGPGLSLRRTIFLGDANALVTPMPRLIPLLEAVHEVYDVAALGGIYAFLDGFSGEKKSAADYRQLAGLGLRRVYIGMESGNRELLRFLKKPGDPDDLVKAVQAMKAGGVAVGIIVLLGAGGHVYARTHMRDTIRTINAMDLDLDDLIYFSELVLSEGMPYVQDAYRADLQPLNAAERLAQAEAIESGLKFSRRGGTPHISRYDIREFVY
jgi:hypothetical protein